MSRNADSIGKEKKQPFDIRIKTKDKSNDKVPKERVFLQTRFCQICGKEFYPTVNWAYKAKVRKSTHVKVLVCSYHCMREAEKKFDDKKPVIRRGVY